ALRLWRSAALCRTRRLARARTRQGCFAATFRAARTALARPRRAHRALPGQGRQRHQCRRHHGRHLECAWLERARDAGGSLAATVDTRLDAAGIVLAERTGRLAEMGA